MIKLIDILKAIDTVKSINTVKGNIEITGITSDSRIVQWGYLFVAVKGTTYDGHDFIEKAFESGAVAVVAENFNQEIKLPVIIVKDSAEALGKLAHRFYGDPSLHLKLIGITGTNGKTSVATLCFNLLKDLGFKAGLISTVENKIQNEIIPSTHTTPDPVQLNALLAKMVTAGCDYAFMEVSSHAAHQKRIAGLQFTGAVFTNITHDHLDYHKTFDHYIRSKKMFFDGLGKDAFALLNADDKHASVMVQNTKAKHYTFSVKGTGDFTARMKENLITGLIMNIDGEEFHSQLPGEFNAWNLLTVYAVGRLLGFNKNELLTALSKQKPVEGRFDVVRSEKEKITGVIDYAHTPDAVEKLLSTIRTMMKKEQQLLTVIGCGGNRDKTKRPVMAKVAARLSDKTIFTSDNPRNEEPQEIIYEMEAGLDADLKNKCLSIINRLEAIKTAVMIAKDGDIVCVAGKGHEKYQEIKGVKYPFDDRKILIETFKNLSR
ncbi:MAG: UDP-N-acetylmuramoyl-L-alanyl-D-glutamate--2,6-diaminopimelate ligase [Chitinophagales bacterium]